MIVRSPPKLPAGLVAVLAGGAVLLAVSGGADAAKVNNGSGTYSTRTVHGGCRQVTTKVCPAGHPPLGGPCRSVTRWVC